MFIGKHSSGITTGTNNHDEHINLLLPLGFEPLTSKSASGRASNSANAASYSKA
jgi:hypothetical protein